MRTIFVLGRTEEGDLEILHSFGTKKPTRADVRKVAAHTPQANVFASLPDGEDERMGKVKILYDLENRTRA